MQVRGSLEVKNKLKLVKPGGLLPSKGLIAVSDSVGNINWSHFKIPELVASNVYPAGTLVFSSGKVYYSLVDEAEGEHISVISTWRELTAEVMGLSLTQDQIDALNEANEPSSGNPYATIKEVQNLKLKGTDSLVSILTKSPVIENNLWISSTEGQDSQGNTVLAGDGLVSTGTTWLGIGPVRGPIGPVGFPDAPIDGKHYARVDGMWVEVDYTVINNLTEGGVEKRLSAEQGKVLKGLIDIIESSKVTKAEGERLITEAEVLKLNEQKSLQDVISINKVADRVKFTKKFFHQGAFTPSNSYFVDYAKGVDGFYVYGSFTAYDGVPAKNVVKIKNDGNIDTTFTPPISINNTPYGSFSILEEIGTKKLLMGGWFTLVNGVSANRLVRFNSDGSVDTTFNVGSGFSDYTTGLCYNIDNTKIYVSGRYFTFNGVSSPQLVRLNLDGTRDAAFNVGTGFGNTANTVLAMDDGGVMVTSYTATYKGISSRGIVKILPDGSVDTTFNVGSGILPTGNDNLHQVIRSHDGKIYLFSNTMTSYNGIPVGRFVKLNMDGSIDNTFEAGTGFSSPISTVSIDSNSRVLITGGMTSYNGVTSFEGTSIYGSIVLNTDGSIYKVPPSKEDNSKGQEMNFFEQLSDGNYVGFIGGSMFSLLNSQFMGQSSKSLTFSETSGSAEYDLEHYYDAKPYEILNKKSVQFYVRDQIKEAGGITEAPIDGKDYVRNNSSWAEVIAPEPPDLSNIYTKDEVNSKLISIYVFRGSKDNFASLPSTGQVVGDVYDTQDTGQNYAWTGSIWDPLGMTIDISGKADSLNAQLTGIPTAPTAPAGTKTDQLATTKFISDYLAESGIIEVTYSELVALIASNLLEIGRQYLLMDYMTTYTQPVTGAAKSSGVVERLYLTVLTSNKLSPLAYSKLYPQDLVYYEVTGDLNDGKGTEGFTKGKIYRRIDTIKNNDIGTDWRHIKYSKEGVDTLLFENYASVTSNQTTVANLPPNLNVGQTFMVTDALNPNSLSPIVGGGSVKCQVFFNGSQWLSMSGSAVVSSGSYTPVFTPVLNVTLNLFYQATYTRIDNIVTVHIGVSLNVDVSGTNTYMNFTLPFPATNGDQVGVGIGNMSTSGAAMNASAIVNVLNTTTAELVLYPVGNGLVRCGISFQYTV